MGKHKLQKLSLISFDGEVITWYSEILRYAPPSVQYHGSFRQVFQNWIFAFWNSTSLYSLHLHSLSRRNLYFYCWGRFRGYWQRSPDPSKLAESTRNSLAEQFWSTKTKTYLYLYLILIVSSYLHLSWNWVRSPIFWCLSL